MLAVIFTLVFAIAVAYFATQNTASVMINIPTYSREIPVYLVVLVSLLVGFVFAWVLHLMNATVSFFAILGKNNAIKKEKKANTQLEKKVQDLETEKTKLEAEKKSQPSQSNPHFLL